MGTLMKPGTQAWGLAIKNATGPLYLASPAGPPAWIESSTIGGGHGVRLRVIPAGQTGPPLGLQINGDGSVSVRGPVARAPHEIGSWPAGWPLAPGALWSSDPILPYQLDQAGNQVPSGSIPAEDVSGGGGGGGGLGELPGGGIEEVLGEGGGIGLAIAGGIGGLLVGGPAGAVVGAAGGYLLGRGQA